MGSYTLLKNQPFVAHLQDDFTDQGWVVSEGIAYHSGCNPGVIRRTFNLSASQEWTFKFKLGPVNSGGINIIVGGISGAVYNTPGEKEEVFAVSHTDAEVLFYSDGENSVEFLEIYPSDANVDGRTIVFNEDENKFGGEHSYTMEFMHKFMDDFFVFKNGELWMQDVNPIHMNFFGQQYTAKLRFVANDRSQFNKLWYGIKIHSNGKWSVPEMITPPNETYPNGMKSTLHENDFDLDRGKYWADIKRDMLDPQFNDELVALFEGRVVEGDMLIIELETKSTTDIKLNSVYVFSADQDRNF